MTPLIAILSHNRIPLLMDLLGSLAGGTTKIVVFDDGTPGVQSAEVHKTDGKHNPISIFAGEHVGVARNSNRALRYFLDRHRYDVLFLLNDDLIVNDLKIFDVYMDAIEKTGYQFFCYTDERSPYKPSAEFTCKGVTLVKRRAGDGCFQVMTRKAVEHLGGYDPGFGIYGGEDLDYQRRAAAAGFSMEVLDVKSVQGKIVPRQYYEDIQCSLGADRARHLAIGSQYWLSTVNQDAVIYKEIET